MSNSNKNDPLLHDPLSEVTRKERRMLLAVSMVGITLVKMELVPTKISALGIEFAKTNQQSLLSIVALVVFYFVIAFLLYASSDFLAWQKTIRARLIDIGRERLEKEQANPELFSRERELAYEYSRRGQYLYVLSKPVAAARAIFEFLLPVIVGIYAIYALLTAQILNT